MIQLEADSMPISPGLTLATALVTLCPAGLVCACSKYTDHSVRNTNYWILCRQSCSEALACGVRDPRDNAALLEQLALGFLAQSHLHEPDMHVGRQASGNFMSEHDMLLPVDQHLDQYEATICMIDHAERYQPCVSASQAQRLL